MGRARGRRMTVDTTKFEALRRPAAQRAKVARFHGNGGHHLCFLGSVLSTPVGSCIVSPYAPTLKVRPLAVFRSFSSASGLALRSTSRTSAPIPDNY